MTNAPTQVIVAAFKTENGADNALEQLRNAQKQHLIDINNVAVLRCDQQGKVHIKEPTDMGGGRGAAIGAVVGGLAGLLFGPVGWAAVGGAAIGGVAAKVRDSGFKDDNLRQLGQSLQPGTSAIVAVIEHTWVVELENELAAAGGDVARHELEDDIAEQLKSGHEVAYTAVVTDDAMVVARATDAPPDAKAGVTSAEGTQPKPEQNPAGGPASSTPTPTPTPTPTSATPS
jgi:uncharacterized membrane protein